MKKRKKDKKNRPNPNRRSLQPNHTIQLKMNRQVKMPYAICTCTEKSEPMEDVLKLGRWVTQHEKDTNGLHVRRSHEGSTTII